MSTSVKKDRNPTFIAKRGFVPTSALADSVEFTDTMMNVYLTDGRIVCVPILWFPALHEANPDQRANYKIGAGGRSLHWPDLDEDLSVAGLLAGADRQAA